MVSEKRTLLAGAVPRNSNHSRQKTYVAVEGFRPPGCYLQIAYHGCASAPLPRFQIASGLGAGEAKPAIAPEWPVKLLRRV